PLPSTRSHLLFFTDPPTSAIYTLSLHDALPIWFLECFPEHAQHDRLGVILLHVKADERAPLLGKPEDGPQSLPHRIGASRWIDRDRKSTRLNSSHVAISYAVFCLKKKNNQ